MASARGVRRRRDCMKKKEGGQCRWVQLAEAKFAPTVHKMSLRALIFDFDGLIVDTETAIVTAWEDMHVEDGLRAERAVLQALVGHVDMTVDMWRAYPSRHDRAVLEERFQRLARRRCVEASVLPGVMKLLDAAQGAGLRLAVASNSSHAHVDEHLAARGLLRRFETVVCRDDVARGKPEPDVYLEVLRRLGVAAGEAVAFEDSVPGHAAAAAAGLRVVVVPNPVTRDERFPFATRRVASLEEVAISCLEELVLA